MHIVALLLYVSLLREGTRRGFHLPVNTAQGVKKKL